MNIYRHNKTLKKLQFIGFFSIFGEYCSFLEKKTMTNTENFFILAFNINR